MLLRRHILLFFKKYIRIGKNSFISLAFLLLSTKSHLFWNLQLFPQNTDVLHFPEGFCIFIPKTIAEYNDLQIPKEKCNLFLSQQ